MLIRQYGVIPYRRETDGSVSILLITSRETRRWVIPRGNPMPGLSGAEAAVREAFEEAGIEGSGDTVPIGAYHYQKRRKSGALVPASVTVFPLRVTRELDAWPERNERERRWFAAPDAAAQVDEEELSALVIKMEHIARGR